MSVVSMGLVLAGSVLSIDGSFLFVFISIFVLIFVLNRTLFRPINRVLEDRDRLGAGRLAESERLLAEYEERLALYEDRLRVARAESFDQLELTRREALAGRAKSIEAVRAETAQLVAAAKDEVVRQVALVRETLEQESRGMASTISSRILDRPISSGGGR